MEKQKLDTTNSIKELLNVVIELEKSRNHVMKPVGFIFKHYDGKAVSDVTEAYATAKHRLWTEINKIYPQTKDGSWFCGLHYIENNI
jgi:hypothetical protein